MNLESFGNDKYKLIRHFYEIQQDYKNEKVIITNKQEIADALHFRKNKVIDILDECIAEGWISRYVSRGKYQLTDKAIKLLQIFSETDL